MYYIVFSAFSSSIIISGSIPEHEIENFLFIKLKVHKGS